MLFQKTVTRQAMTEFLHCWLVWHPYRIHLDPYWPNTKEEFAPGMKCCSDTI